MGSLGETLAEERRRRGRTIADAEAATRIRGRLLEALENGRYDELPSPAYVKGYIQSYAHFLELPVRPLIDQYAAERRLAPETHIEGNQLDLPADAVVPRRAQAAEMPMRTWVTIMVILVVGGLLSWGAVSLMARPKVTPMPTPSPTTTETAPVKKNSQSTPPPSDEESRQPAVSDEPTDTGAETTEEQSKKFTLRVSVDSGSASWMRVTVDGLKAYEGTLEGGNVKEWRVTESAKLRIGRPSAVTVTRDGEPVEIRDTGNIGVVELSTSGE